jgi:hypothetical protein
MKKRARGLTLCTFPHISSLSVYAFKIVKNGGAPLWQHGYFHVQQTGTMNFITGGVFDHVKYDVDIVIVDLANSL